jgi:prolyl 4-hydroxylase
MARIVPVAPTQLLSDFPRVVTLPNFLTSEECAHVRDIVRSSLNPSELGTTRLNVSGMKSDARTSTSAFIDQSKDAVIRAIEERVAHVVAVPHSHVGRLHVGHYSPGQRFAIHYDALTKAEMKVQTNGFTRIATVLVYLNTMHCDGKVTQDVQGPQYRTNYEFVAKKASELCPSPSNGHTQFPMLGVSVAPVEGTAIYFQNVDQDWERIAGSLHSGAPVCCNEKWVMNAWCYNQPLYEGMIARYTDEGEEADIKDGESIAGKGL